MEYIVYEQKGQYGVITISREKALNALKNVKKQNLWPLYEMAEFFKTRTY